MNHLGHKPGSLLTRAGRIISKGISKVFTPESARLFQVASHHAFIPYLPDEFENLRIVQLSDIHFYEYGCKDYYQNVVDTVNALKPDLIVATGDVIHYGQEYLGMAEHFLSQMEAPMGKWACMGNHDYSDDYRGLGVRMMQQAAGFTVLVNDALPLEKEGKRLWLSGIDDVKMSCPDIEKAFKPIDTRQDCHISLVHNPKLAPYLAKHSLAPNLILAGHTHGGQINNLLVNLAHKHIFRQEYLYGWFNFGDTSLYVTSGVGSATVSVHIGPHFDFALYPFRINTIPEVAVFDLTGTPQTPSQVIYYAGETDLIRAS